MNPESAKEVLIDKLVLQYIDTRYPKIGDALRSELSQRGVNRMTLAPQIDPKTGTFGSMLYYLASEGDPSQYAKSFDALVTWTENSLDQYQPELRRILYPVFIQSFLELVERGAPGEASQMMMRYKRRFAEHSKMRAQELDDLQGVSQKAQVATNRTAQAARSIRYPVKLSRYSFDLLMTYLQTHKLLLPLGIINEHVNIQVVEGRPARLEQEPEEEEVSLLAGHMQEDVTTTNQKPLRLGLLKGTVEEKFEELQAAKESPHAPEVDADGKPLTKKARTALLRAAEKEREARRLAASERIAPEVPLPPIPEGLERDLLEDMENQVDLSTTALPSAIFYTFVNTHRSLNCVNFTCDGSMLAGGFADSSVRLYDMAKRFGKRDRDSSTGASIFRGHSRPVYAVSFSQDGQLLLSASGDGTVRLWSTELSANLVAYRGHCFPVWDVAAGPLGHYFASASADRTARVWCTERAQPLRLLVGHHSDVSAVRWHPNSHYVATGSHDRTVRLWDIRDGKSQRILIGHRAAITSLVFAPDGRTLYSGDDDGVISVWDMDQAKRMHILSGHSGPVWSLAASHGTGGLIASGGADNTLRLWNKAGKLAGADAPAQGLLEQKPLQTYATKATPVFCVKFTRRNLLLGSGALTLKSK